MATKKPSYAEQLRNPKWQKKRLEILSRDEFCCQLCFDSESTLHVHHKRYVKGRMPWEYDNRDLVTVCENCHDSAEEIRQESIEVMAALHLDGPGSASEVKFLVSGWAARHGVEGFDTTTEYGALPFSGGVIAACMARQAWGMSKEIIRIADLIWEADHEKVERVVAAMLAELEGD